MSQREVVIETFALILMSLLIGLVMGAALERHAWHPTLPSRVVEGEPKWMLTCAAPSVLTGQGYVLTTIDCYDDAGTGTRMFADLVDSIRDGGSAGGAR